MYTAAQCSPAGTAGLLCSYPLTFLEAKCLWCNTPRSIFPTISLDCSSEEKGHNTYHNLKCIPFPTPSTSYTFPSGFLAPRTAQSVSWWCRDGWADCLPPSCLDYRQDQAYFIQDICPAWGPVHVIIQQGHHSGTDLRGQHSLASYRCSITPFAGRVQSLLGM